MNRFWVVGFWAVVCLGAWGCSGKVDVTGSEPDASSGGSGGGAGSAGQGGMAGGSGGVAGFGGGSADWMNCPGPGTCAKEYHCCPPCGPEGLDDIVGVNRYMRDQYYVAECGSTHPPCPGCATQIDINLTAFCVAGTCKAVDVRSDPVSACTNNDDCILEPGQCCACGLLGPESIVAVAKSQNSYFISQICEPNTGCPACGYELPAGYAAECGPDSHCRVSAFSGCPLQEPSGNQACNQEGMTCSWGDDIRIHCRPTATCVNGTWTWTPQPNCPPLPGAGQAGCPQSMAAQGGWCPGMTGQICDMSSVAGLGAMCICDQCLGGPCTQYGRWNCVQSSQGCPPVAPNPNTACSSQGLSCVYGGCYWETSAGFSCSEGLWASEPIACPE